MSRTRLGGDKRFAYFDQDYDRAEFLLKKDNNAPKLDGFIKGQRYRIEIETESSTQVYKISFNLLFYGLFFITEQTLTL